MTLMDQLPDEPFEESAVQQKPLTILKISQVREQNQQYQNSCLFHPCNPPQQNCPLLPFQRLRRLMFSDKFHVLYGGEVSSSSANVVNEKRWVSHPHPRLEDPSNRRGAQLRRVQVREILCTFSANRSASQQRKGMICGRTSGRRHVDGFPAERNYVWSTVYTTTPCIVNTVTFPLDPGNASSQKLSKPTCNLELHNDKVSRR